VLKVDAAVHQAEHDPRAAVAEPAPDVCRPDPLDAPGRQLRRRGGLGLWQLHLLVGTDARDLGQRSQRLEPGAVDGRGEPIEDPVALQGRDVPVRPQLGQRGRDRGTTLPSDVLQAVHDRSRTRGLGRLRHLAADRSGRERAVGQALTSVEPRLDALRGRLLPQLAGRHLRAEPDDDLDRSVLRRPAYVGLGSFIGEQRRRYVGRSVGVAVGGPCRLACDARDREAVGDVGQATPGPLGRRLCRPVGQPLGRLRGGPGRGIHRAEGDHHGRAEGS